MFFNLLFSGRHSQFSAEIADHQFYFHVMSAPESRINNLIGEKNIGNSSNNFDSIDTFTLQLPRVCASGSYELPKSDGFDLSKQDGWNCAELVYRNEGYYNISIVISNFCE